MANGKLRDTLSLFDTTLSSAEWAWRIVAVVAIGCSGAAGGVLARADPFLKNLGPLYWLGVGLATALAVTLILYLVKAANHKQSLAELNATLATPRNTVNPLAHTFTDLIIPVEDLRLPTVQLLENKLLSAVSLLVLPPSQSKAALTLTIASLSAVTSSRYQKARI